MKYQELIATMRTKYYNPSDGLEREKLSAALEQGMMIVSAPRPLPGEESWSGSWCAGVYWAIGELTVYSKDWQDLDATIVLLVDNNMLLEIAKENHEKKMSNPSYAMFYPSWDDATSKYNPKQIVKNLVPNAPWLES